MDHNTSKTWIHSALGKELAEASIRRETDQDARRLSLSTDELRRTAEAVEGNAWSSREALNVIVPADSEPIAQWSEPNRLKADVPRIERTDRAKENRSAAAPERKPQPQHEDQRLERAQSLTNLLGPTNAHVSRSIPTAVVLGKYARTMPVASPASRYTDPLMGREQASDVIDREARNDVIFPETPGALPGEVETHQGRGGDKREFPFAAAPERRPVGRTSIPRVVQQDAATELTMAKALTVDRTFGDQAIGSALSGSRDAPGPGDRRPSSTNARPMIEPNRGSERPVSPGSGAQASPSGTESMEAATHELERLRSAARRTADELEKVRGPVPPAFPARPPIFRDRS
jgi:hypothetical protein